MYLKVCPSISRFRAVMLHALGREDKLVFLLNITLIMLITTGLKSMNSLSLDTLTRQTAIHSIQIYQRHLSPRKGYSCPHRVLYKEDSWSDYVKHLLMKRDLTSAIQMSVQRFRSCALAAQELKLQNQGGCIVIPCCIPL